MPTLAYYVIAAVVLAIVAVGVFFIVDPLTGIFMLVAAHFLLKLEERNE